MVLDEGPIFSQLVIFDLIFSPNLGGYELRIREDFDFSCSHVLGKAETGEESFVLYLIVGSRE